METRPRTPNAAAPQRPEHAGRHGYCLTIIGEGAFHERVVTSGTARFNDDAGNIPGGRRRASYMAAHRHQEVSNISITQGCGAGTNLSGLIRWAQVNGQTYAFGS